jgi:hypothetical protein
LIDISKTIILLFEERVQSMYLGETTLEFFVFVAVEWDYFENHLGGFIGKFYSEDLFADVVGVIDRINNFNFISLFMHKSARIRIYFDSLIADFKRFISKMSL